MAEFKVEVEGNWCRGYYWRLVDARTGHVCKEDGPYHQAYGDLLALRDAVDYAARHDLRLDKEYQHSLPR